MTHLIEHWQRPGHVMAVQTTNTLMQHVDFDVHPRQAKPAAIQQLVTAFKLPHAPQFLQQVHGHQVVEYTEPPKNQLQHQADACFTRAKNVICAVMTADCLPVLLTDTAGSFVAAIHCGWRSLYSNVLCEALNKINSSQQVLAWFGPCIQPAQYEVDADFVHHYLTKHPNSQAAFSVLIDGKSQASLYSLAEIQLRALGIANIQHANQCTFAQPAYYSWRQNSTKQRMASLVWLDTTAQSP